MNKRAYKYSPSRLTRYLCSFQYYVIKLSLGINSNNKLNQFQLTNFCSPLKDPRYKRSLTAHITTVYHLK